MPNRRAATQARQDQPMEEHFPVQAHSIHDMDEEYDPEPSVDAANGLGRTLSFLWGLKVRPRQGVIYDVPEDHYLVISMASLGAADPKGKRSALLIEDAGFPDDYEEGAYDDDDDDDVDREADVDEENDNVATGNEDEDEYPASDPESDADSSSVEEQEALMNGFENQASESDEEEEASEASFSAGSASVSSSSASASEQSSSSSTDEVSDDDDDAKCPLKEAIVACVLLRGRVESQPLNLEIVGPRRLRFWAHGKDTIHLTGHIEIESTAKFGSDDEYDEDDMEMDYSGSESDGGIADYSASGSSSASDDEPLPPPPSQRRSIRITEIEEEENQDGMKVDETTAPPTRSKLRSTSAAAARGAAGDVSASPSRPSEVKGSKSDQKVSRDSAVSPATVKTEQSTPSRGKKNQASAAHNNQTGDASAQSGKHVRFLSSADEKGAEGAKKRARGDSSLASPAAAQSPAGNSSGGAVATVGNLPTGITCSKCAKSFKLASALEQHMKAKHAS